MFLLSFFLSLTMTWTSQAAVFIPAGTESAWSTRAFQSVADSMFRKKLTEKAPWISAEFIKTDLSPLIRVIKSWETDGTSIHETSTMSGPPLEEWVLEKDEDELYPWTQFQSELTSPRLHEIWNSTDETPVIKQLEAHAFIVEFERTYVLIFSPSNKKTSPLLSESPVAVFETPWPFLPDFLLGKQFFGVPPVTPRPIIVVPTTESRRLFATSKFPKAFLPAVSSASQAWNQATALSVYGELSTKIQSPWLCLIHESVCLHWEGMADIPLAGLSAATQFIYDPVSGRKFGTVIQFLNLPHQQSPGANIQERIPFEKSLPTSGKNTVTQTLLTLLTTANPRSYLHPSPDALVTSFLIHEFGHDLGLRHDFAASTISDSRRPESPASVMDYLPWPIMHLVSKPGALDVARIRSTLGLNTPGLSKKDIVLRCSDPDVGKSVGCTGGDWGHPFYWLDTAATIDPSLQTKLYLGGGLESLRHEGITIEKLIQRLLNEDSGNTNLSKQMVKQLRSRIDQKQRPQ